MASVLGCRPTPAYEDAGAVLMLDREPIAWSGSRQRGLGWIEGELWDPAKRVTTWEQAAGSGLAGFVLSGRRRYLHTSLNGLTPIYWMEEGGAVYFASGIDPLARTAARLLSVDWEAWTGIIAMRYPLGQRTPFAEIRRLPAYSTLRRRLRRALVAEQEWPWATVEPKLKVDAAADQLVEALDANLALVEEPVISPLSGGRDSRLLFIALARDGRVAGGVTTPDDEGGTYEEELAAPVADALRIPHERLQPAPGDYGEDWGLRARRVEYQFVDHAWLVPVARRVEGLTQPVPDGFGIDILFCSGRHFYTKETLAPGREAQLAMYDMLRRYGRAQLALEDRFHGAIEANAREQYLATTRRFQGHPSQGLLSLYWTRSLRGISNYPTGLLGQGTRIMAPGVSRDVAAASLSAPSSEKLGGQLYDAVYERLGVAAGMLPSTSDTARQPPYLPRRWLSQEALEHYRSLLRDGPLTPHLSADLRSWLEAPDSVELSADLRLGMESISLLHAWWHRYRGVLGPTDPAALLA